MDSSAPSCVESCLSRSRATAGSYGRRLGRAARDATDRRSRSSPPFWHDGTERPIQRPKDPEAQQEYYRGKKTSHTRKNLIVINQMSYICFLHHYDEDNAADKSMAELPGYTVPPGSYLYQDKGVPVFFLHGITIVQPKKKPPGAELTPPEHATNRQIE